MYLIIINWCINKVSFSFKNQILTRRLINKAITKHIAARASLVMPSYTSNIDITTTDEREIMEFVYVIRFSANHPPVALGA